MFVVLRRRPIVRDCSVVLDRSPVDEHIYSESPGRSSGEDSGPRDPPSPTVSRGASSDNEPFGASSFPLEGNADGVYFAEESES